MSCAKVDCSHLNPDAERLTDHHNGFVTLKVFELPDDGLD